MVGMPGFWPGFGRYIGGPGGVGGGGGGGRERNSVLQVYRDRIIQFYSFKKINVLQIQCIKHPI